MVGHASKHEAKKLQRYMEMQRAASKGKRQHWQAMREAASTPAYTVQETENGQYHVVGGCNRVAGPFSNAEAWRWVERNTTVRRYGQ